MSPSGQISGSSFDIPDNRLAAAFDIHIFDRDLLLAFAAVLVERGELAGIENPSCVAHDRVSAACDGRFA